MPDIEPVERETDDTPLYSLDLTGIEGRLDEFKTMLEEWREEDKRPALTTPFSEYTVTEGLLLLLFLAVLGSQLIRMIKGAFHWLCW